MANATYKQSQDKTWTYRIYYKDANGKKREKKGTGFKTQKLAKSVAEPIVYDLNRNINVLEAERFFTDYYTDWCNTFKYGKFSNVTDDSYKTAEKVVKEYFSGMRLKDITAMDYQNFLNDYAKTRSKETVRKNHNKIAAAFKHAFHNGIIPVNIVYSALITGKSGKSKNDKFLSEKELQKVTAELHKNIKLEWTSRYMLLLQASTGMRVGEVMALTFDSFDLTNETLTINKSWDYKHTRTFKNTKNGVHRKIDLDPVTISIMTPYLIFQKKRSFEMPIKNKKNLVFTDDKMNVIDVNAVNKSLKRACQRAGVQVITSHGLRHTHASILLKDKIDLGVVAERLGDAPETIMSVYAHVLDEMRDRDRDKIKNVSANTFSFAESI